MRILDGCGGVMSIYWGGSFRESNVMSLVFLCFILVFDNVVDLGWVCDVPFPSVEGGTIDLVCTSLE